jgi:perosamine synthetase
VKKFKYFIPVNRPLLNENDVNSVSLTVKSGWVSSGSKITEFEKRFANYANKKYASCVSSGSAALEIAIKSLNISCGDEVITPAFSIISNSNAIIKNLAKPILVDTDLDTWNIDINQMEKKISSKTKAIMLPHIYGFPNDMDKIQKICRLYKLYLIEDASEMIGQKYKKKVCGSFGDVSTFSFYVNKHITTGEGGMIVTNDKKIHNKINELKNLSFGKKNRFNHDDIGWNYRFTNLQAALGLSQLNRIKQIVKKNTNRSVLLRQFNKQ